MKKIIVAPLNWGLGHATRCIPIIESLIHFDFVPVICSDGDALVLLQKEFPSLNSYELPSYQIEYSKKGKSLKYKLLSNYPKIRKAIKKEKTLIEEIIEKENIRGIISDNRFGVRSDKVVSIYLTHQINVLSGMTTSVTSLFHQEVIKKFNYCWIPDYKHEPSLAGKLSHPNKKITNEVYIGPISRFQYKSLKKKYDLIVILSGPEPQKSILEKKLMNELKSYKKRVLFVRGVVEEEQEFTQFNHIEIVNYLLKDQLEKAINQSELVLSRSGYSTIMDLEKMHAKAFFIPTPGQYEQEYLAKRLDDLKICAFATQDKFQIEMLNSLKEYKGFENKKTSNNNSYELLLDVFK